MDEKRSYIRWNLVLPARSLETATRKEGVCHIQDISMSGAKVAMAEKYSLGDRFDVVFELPGNNGKTLCVEAEVVWQREAQELKEGCKYMAGLVFRKFCDNHKKTILDYINVTYPGMFRQRWWDGV